VASRVDARHPQAFEARSEFKGATARAQDERARTGYGGGVRGCCAVIELGFSSFDWPLAVLFQMRP